MKIFFLLVAVFAVANAQEEANSTAGNVCTPAGACTVCAPCCKPYMTPQAVCDKCAAAECAESKNILGAYFANWAQYHPSPYKHTAASLAPIAHRLDLLLYSFIYFCPPAGTNPMPYWAKSPFGSCTDATEFQLMSVESKDAQFLPQIAGYKSQNSKLKVILSIGGWNFASEYFSKMVATSAGRAKFIQSCMAWMSKYGYDGIDLDWEFPCSAPRKDYVKITCDFFRNLEDKGGNCPADPQNLLLLAKEMRAAFGPSKYISIASQAAKKNELNENIRAVTQYIDRWHVMSYDYSVSDLDGATVMAANCPLYMPPKPVPQMCVNKTISDYKAFGVPKSKIMIGIPYYGHTWYNPQLGSNWNKFGNTAQRQSKCCGPFKQTYGAKPGKGSGLCGTMMYSEIVAAGPDKMFYDKKTESALAYWSKAGGDGYTEAGTWVTYNDKQSIAAITKYGMENAAGVFIFDTSMDTLQTYELTNAIANQLGGH